MSRSLLMLALLFLLPAAAEAASPWQGWGRRIGLGWGDGYHAASRPTYGACHVFPISPPPAYLPISGHPHGAELKPAPLRPWPITPPPRGSAYLSPEPSRR